MDGLPVFARSPRSRRGPRVRPSATAGTINPRT
jgi:hypothetical protein